MTPVRAGVQIGDEFKCKRRGHILKIVQLDPMPESSSLVAFCLSTRGRNIQIRVSRLLTPYRFERVVAHALPEHAEVA